MASNSIPSLQGADAENTTIGMESALLICF